MSECLGDSTQSLKGPATSGVRDPRSLSGESLQLIASEHSLPQASSPAVPGWCRCGAREEAAEEDEGGGRNGGDKTPLKGKGKFWGRPGVHQTRKTLQGRSQTPGSSLSPIKSSEGAEIKGCVP